MKKRIFRKFLLCLFAFILSFSFFWFGKDKNLEARESVTYSYVTGSGWDGNIPDIVYPGDKITLDDREEEVGIYVTTDEGNYDLGNSLFTELDGMNTYTFEEEYQFVGVDGGNVIKFDRRFSIEYDINGGTGVTPTESNKYIIGNAVSLNDGTEFTNSGFTFGGWSTDMSATSGNEGNYTLVKTDAPSFGTVITFYAIWNESTSYSDEVEININNVLEYGLKTSDIEISVSDDDLKVSKFVLWYFDSKIVNPRYVVCNEVLKPGLYLFCIEIEGKDGNLYFVNTEEGQLGYSNYISVSYNYDVFQYNLSGVGQTKCDFEENDWFLTHASATEPTTNIKLGCTLAISFTGYTVKYDDNVDDVVIDVPKDLDEYLLNSSVPISTTIPSRMGYVFMGWNTNKDATKPLSFTDNKYKITESDFPNEEDYITFYAIWKKVIVSEPSSTNDYEVKVDTSLTNVTYKWYKYVSSSVDVKNSTNIKRVESIGSESGGVYTSGKMFNLYLIKFEPSNTSVDITSVYVSFTYNGKTYTVQGRGVVGKNSPGVYIYNPSCTNVSWDDPNNVSFTISNVKEVIKTGVLIENETKAKFSLSTLEDTSYYCEVLIDNKVVATSNIITPDKVDFYEGCEDDSKVYKTLYQLKGRSITIPDKPSEKKGYKFLGWNTNKDATSALTFNNGKYEISTNNVSFYPIWQEKKEVSITETAQTYLFGTENAEFEILGTTLTDFTVKYKRSTNVYTSAPTGIGYYNVVIHRDECDDYKEFDLTITNGFGIYCTVTYQKGDATSGKAPVDSNKYDSNEYTYRILDNAYLERTGYKFVGWKEKSDTIGLIYYPGDKCDFGVRNYVYVPIWEVKLKDISKDNNYTVSYTATDLIGNPTYQWLKFENIDLDDISSENYYFYNDTKNGLTGAYKGNNTIGSNYEEGFMSQSIYLFINKKSVSEYVSISFKSAEETLYNVAALEDSKMTLVKDAKGFYTIKLAETTIINGYYSLYITAIEKTAFDITDVIFNNMPSPIKNETGSSIGNANENTLYYCAFTYKSMENGSEVTKTVYTNTVSTKEISFNGGEDATGDDPSAIYQLEGRSISFPESSYTRQGYKFIGWNTDSQATTGLTGTYTVTSNNVTLYAIWEKKVDVSIVEKAQSYTYNGSGQNFAIDGNIKTGFTVKFALHKDSHLDADWSTSTPSNAASYDVLISRSEDGTYCEYSKIISNGLVINKLKVAEPTVKGTYTYTGSTQTVSFNGKETYMSTTDSLTQTNANSYTITFTLDSNHEWAEGSDGKVTWTIKKYSILDKDVSYTENNFIYNGKDQVENVTAKYKNVKGDMVDLVIDEVSPILLDFIDAGKYDTSFIFATKGESNNYEFASSNSNYFYVEYEMKAKEIVIDWCNDDFTYSGSEQTITASYKDVNNKDVSLTVTVNKTFKDAGSYEAEVSLANNETNYKLPTTVTKDYKINKLKVAEPTVKGTYTYTGSAQTVSFNGKETYMSTTDSLTQTNANSYTITFTLDSNHEWAEGSDGKVIWIINKPKATITVDQTPIVKTYGDTITLPKATSTFGSVVCDTKVSDLVNANTYTVTYSVASTSNYDGDSKTVTVVINKAKVAEPTIKGTYTYTGNPQTVSLKGKETYMSTTDSLTQTNANSYTITFTLDSNHEWAEGSDGKLTWTINKAKASISVNQTPIVKTYGQTITLPNATSTFGVVTCDTDSKDLVNANAYTVTYSVASTSNYDGDSKVVNVVINKAKVSEPKVTGTYTYTGSAQTVSLIGKETYMSTTDSLTQINANDYTITFTLDSNHEWADGSDGKLTWTINKLKVLEPTVVGSYTYTGSPQTVSLKGKETYMSTTNSLTQTNVGSYTIVYTLDSNHEWDSSSDGKITWTINKIKASISVDQTQIIKTYGDMITLPKATSTFGVVTCDTDAKDLVNVGSYTITYTVASTIDYDGDSKTVTVVINKAKVSEPKVAGTYTYTGNPQTVSLIGTETYMSTTDSLIQTNAGNYTIIYNLDSNHEWNEGSDGLITWTINKLKVAEPIVTGTYTYTGNEQQVEIKGLEPYMEATGSIKATNAGTYDVLFILDSNHEWDSNSDGKVSWTINKASALITVDQTPIVKTYKEEVILPKASSNFGVVLCNTLGLMLADAGEYIVKYSVLETTNYYGDEKTVLVIINKAKVSEPTVTGTYTYTGKEQKVRLNGVRSFMSTSSDLKATDVGEYTISYTLDNNHEWDEGSDGIISWTINKAYALINVDQTPIVKKYNEEITLPKATSNLGVVSCSAKESDFNHVGTYTIVYRVNETKNYYGDEKSVSVTINKGKYDMSNVSFNDAIVAYDGTVHSITITGDLPEGISVYYSGNEQTNIGTYAVTASFVGDMRNYEDISPLYANLTIRNVSINPEGNKDVKVEYDGGFGEDIIVVIEIVVEENIIEQISLSKLEVDYYHLDGSAKLSLDEEIGVIFDVKLYRVIGAVREEIQPSQIAPGAKIKVKMLIPKEIDVSKITRILHVHSKDDIESIEFDASNIDEDGYYIMEIDRLSEFAFVYKKDKCFVHWILFALLILFELFVVILNSAGKVKHFVEDGHVNISIIIGLLIYAVLIGLIGYLSACMICYFFLALNILAFLVTILVYSIKRKKRYYYR